MPGLRLYVDIHFGTDIVCIVMSALAVLNGAFWHICMSFVFRCVYFMSSRVHARVVFLSFPSRRYYRLGSSGGWDAPTEVLTLWVSGDFL